MALAGLCVDVLCAKVTDVLLGSDELDLDQLVFFLKLCDMPPPCIHVPGPTGTGPVLRHEDCTHVVNPNVDWSLEWNSKEQRDLSHKGCFPHSFCTCIEFSLTARQGHCLLAS